MIDPYDEIPKYHQLARILRNKITDGEWEPQSAIPSPERQLEQQYRISRPTIRQAIELLIREGYLYREHGKGTFVMPQKLQKGLLELTSFSEDLINGGSGLGRWCAASHAKSRRMQISRKLDMPVDGKTLRIERIRLGDGIPIGLQTSYLALG